MKATKNYLLRLSLLVCMLFSFMAVTAGAAYKSYEGLYDYVLNNGNAVIIGYSGISSTLKIPATIQNAAGTKTYSVISVGNGTKPILSSSKTKEVIIPDSAIRIATNAFLDCTSLQKVTIGKQVKTIGDSAFQGCTALTTVTNNSTALTQLGDADFYGCLSLTAFDCGPVMELIGDSAFTGCKALTEVKLSPCLYAIGENAFKNCTSLAKATDGADHSGDVKRYGDVPSFDNYLPASLEVLGAYAFYNCALQDYLVVPANVLEISDAAFQNCKKLKGVYLTTGIKTLGENAFKGCTSLEFMFAPKSLGEVADTAFAGAALDDSRTSVYLFKNSYIDEYLNSTKQYNAHMFEYLNSALVTLPPTTMIKLTAPDCPDPENPVIWAGQTVDLAVSFVSKTTGLPVAPPSAEIGDAVTWDTNREDAIIFVKRNQASSSVTSSKSGTGYVVKAILNNDVDGDINIRVNPAPKTVSIVKSGSTTPSAQFNIDLIKTKSIDLDAVTAPMNGAEVEWTTSNKEVATVDDTGLVTWAGKEGVANITATTYNGKKATVQITFKYKYDSTNTSAFVKAETLIVTMFGGKSQITKDPTGFAPTTTYSLSDPSVVKLTPDGFIEPLKTGVTTLVGSDVSGTIAPTGKAYKFKCTIIVKPAKQVINSKVTKKTTGYKVTWKAILNGSGYDIQVKAPGASSFKTLTTVKRTNKQNYYVFPNFKAGKTYQVRVRSYLNYNGKKYPGAWSDPLSVTAKK